MFAIEPSHGYAGQLHRDPMLIYVCCAQHFFSSNNDFVVSTNTINICLILSTLTVVFLGVAA